MPGQPGSEGVHKKSLKLVLTTGIFRCTFLVDNKHHKYGTMEVHRGMMVAEGLARYGLMNTDQAARRLGISKNGVTGAIGRGALRADKVKGQWEISEEAVEEYEANHLGRRGQISREKAAERAAKTSQTAMEKRITNEMLWKWMQQQSEVNEAVLQRLDRVDLRPGSEPSDPDMDLRAELADLKSRVDQIEERLRNLGRLISGE